MVLLMLQITVDIGHKTLSLMDEVHVVPGLITYLHATYDCWSLYCIDVFYMQQWQYFI